MDSLVKSLIQEKIQSRCRKLCETLRKKYKPEGDDLEILKRNEKKLMDAFYRGYKFQSLALQSCMEKLISVPEYVLLNEDKIQVNQYTDENMSEIKNKLDNLQQRLKKAIVFNAIINEEMEIIEQFHRNINKAINVCDIIDNGTKYPDINETILKSAESYEELQSHFDKSNDKYIPRNKRRCLMYKEDSYDKKFP